MVNFFLRLTVGTAGHIDHGKSTLIKALTGTDPDRLKEEQERGMTIDIGFAEYRLPDGRLVGIVDVPGHERFIKNMVAGATGMNFVILVVAADDGVMPQTREHLEIMELLGVKDGIVALTKCDLVDADMVELAREDVRDFLKGTFLQDAPIVPLSASTGDGIDEFRTLFEEKVLALTPPEPSGVFRMPVQRVFFLKGFGTIVTGIPTSGVCRIGERVHIYPHGEDGRIRSIQVYKTAVEEAQAFHRTALNLAEVDYKSIKRGDVVAPEDSLAVSNIVEVLYRHLGSASAPLKRGSPIRLHIGTQEVLGSAFPLETTTVKPSEEGIVELRLSQPAVCAIGDRFILRLASPLRTIGGGVVLDLPRKRPRKMRHFAVKMLKQRSQRIGNLTDTVESIIRMSDIQPLSSHRIAQLLALKTEEVEPLVQKLIEKRCVLRLESGLVHQDGVKTAGKRILRSLETYFRRNPLKLYCRASTLLGRTKMDEDLFDVALRGLLEDGKLVVEDERVGIAGRRVELTSESARIAAELERIYKDTGLKAPNKSEVMSIVGGQTTRIEMLYEYLCESGVLLRLTDNLYIHRDAFNAATESVRSYIKENGKIDAQGAKELFGLSRKYVIPLLEEMDRRKVTRRIGDHRVLRDAPQTPQA